MVHASQLAREGAAVYIVCANQHHARQMQELFTPSSGIKCESWNSLGNLEIESLTLRGAHSNVVVLVDHFAIENRFNRLLEMLHRYDNPKINSGTKEQG
jgi:hypothetical protein